MTTREMHPPPPGAVITAPSSPQSNGHGSIRTSTTPLWSLSQSSVHVPDWVWQSRELQLKNAWMSHTNSVLTHPPLTMQSGAWQFLSTSKMDFCWDFNFHSLTAEPLGLATELRKREKWTEEAAGNSELEGSSKWPKHSPSRGTGYFNLAKWQKEKVPPWKVMGQVT